MHITTYADAKDFLARTEAILLQDEAASGLMYGLSRQLVDEPHLYGDEDPFFATVDFSTADFPTVDNGETQIVAAIRTPPYSLVVRGDGSRTRAALESLAAYLYGRDVKLPGINGPVEPSRFFAKTWARLSRIPYRLKLNLRVFELRQVDWPAMPDGHLRPVTEADRALLSHWIREFQREALDKDADEMVAWSQERAARSLREGGTFMWENNGPVSLVSRARSTPNGVTVNMVYTPPEQRQKGYASAAVATLSQMILDEGYDFCTLFTDLANPTSNSIYQKIGYLPVCDFAEYVFGRGKVRD